MLADVDAEVEETHPLGDKKVRYFKEKRITTTGSKDGVDSQDNNHK